jgi:hypothetical protein
MAKCKFCTKEITWLKDGRKFMALNPDGGEHKCEERQKTINSLKTFDKSSLSPEEIAKYEEAINSKK